MPKSSKSQEGDVMKTVRVGIALLMVLLLYAIAVAPDVKLRLVLGVVLIGIPTLEYLRMDLSRKRFIKHLVRQIPFLPGRYVA